MLGQIHWTQDRKVRMERERILGLPVLGLYLPLRRWETERKIRKGAQLLIRHGVTRVLTPPEFLWWPVLKEQGLRPVATGALRCALAPLWVEQMLGKKGVNGSRATVVLKGEREAPEMVWIARDLCSFVRNLAFDIPNAEGLGARLRKEYGLPILPVRVSREDVTLCFEDGPVLSGVEYALKHADIPPDCDVLPMLSALWESGRVKIEDILLKV